MENRGYINLDHERSTTRLSNYQIFVELVNSILLRNSRCKQIIKVQRTRNPFLGRFSSEIDLV